MKKQIKVLFVEAINYLIEGVDFNGIKVQELEEVTDSMLEDFSLIPSLIIDAKYAASVVSKNLSNVQVEALKRTSSSELEGYEVMVHKVGERFNSDEYKLVIQSLLVDELESWIYSVESQFNEIFMGTEDYKEFIIEVRKLIEFCDVDIRFLSDTELNKLSNLFN